MQRNGTHKGRGEGAQVLQGVARGKFSKLGARSGPRTRSAHPPSQSIRRSHLSYHGRGSVVKDIKGLSCRLSGTSTSLKGISVVRVPASFRHKCRSRRQFEKGKLGMKVLRGQSRGL